MQYMARRLLLALVILMVPGAGAAMDDVELLRRFVAAKDPQRRAQAIREGVAAVSTLVLRLSHDGLAAMANDKDDPFYLDLAEAVAASYAAEFGNEGLLELVRSYQLYDRQTSRKKLRGDDLYLQAQSLFNEKGQWAEALQKLTEAMQLYTDTGDTDGQATANFAMAIIHESRKHHEDALGLYRKALELERRLGAEVRVAASLERIGIIQHALVQYRAAVASFEEAAATQQRLGNAREESELLGKAGIAYKDLREYSSALRSYGRALAIAQKLGDAASQANTLGDIANAHVQLGRYDEALNYFQQARAIFRRLGDWSGEAHVAHGIGLIHEKRGQFADALKSYQQSLELRRDRGKGAGEAEALKTIALLHVGTGRYQDALNFHHQALDRARTSRDAAAEADALGNIGDVYFLVRRLPEARDFYEQALAAYRSSGNEKGEGRVLKNVAVVYERSGEFGKAVSAFERSLEIARRTRDVDAEAQALVNVTSYYVKIGQNEEAETRIMQTLELAERRKDRFLELISRANLGLVYASRKKYDEAVPLLRRANQLAQQQGHLEFQWAGQAGLAQALAGSGRLEEAASAYEDAIRSIEALYARNEAFDEERRSSFIQNKQGVYKDYFEVLVELHRKAPGNGYDRRAFLLSERAKSRVFLELLGKARARASFGGDAAFQQMAEKERVLMEELARLAQRLRNQAAGAGGDDPGGLESLKAELARIEQELIRHRQLVDQTYPRYADLKRPRPLTVEALQMVLLPDETLLSYAVGGDKLIAFVITKKRFKLLELGVGRFELFGLVRRFRAGLDRVDASESADEEVIDLHDLEQFSPEASYEIYRKIFLPVAKELAGATSIYISADELLYTLPFEALVDRPFDPEAFNEAREKGKQAGWYLSEYRSLHYLVDTYTFTYLPSASVLRMLRAYEKPGYGRWRKPLVAFADPVFSDEEGGGARKLQELGNVQLPRLADSGEEARAIAREVAGSPKDIYLRASATEENVHAADLSATRYLLFATHGLLGGEFGAVTEPALVLTLVGNPPSRDGLLTMSEILRLDLNAQLVVLSACNTAGGAKSADAAEGFAGLARSFMYAGTRSLLVTHWKVESRAARDLMVATFRTKNVAFAGALRQAKLDMKQASRQVGHGAQGQVALAHPFFWASFVLLGEPK